MTKKELTTIELSEAQAEKYSAKQIKTDLIPRLSNRRCKTFLVQKIETGVVGVPAEKIGAWTYKAVAVKGVDVGDVAGKQAPIKTLEKAVYAKLDAKGVATLIEMHTTEKKAALIVQALLEGGSLKPNPRDLVYLSNSRITVAGVSIESSRKGVDMGALVAGVTINQPGADDAAA